MWDNLRGHQHQRDLFQRAARAGRLSHAYLFAGPSGVGKRHFARCLAEALLCERSDDAALAACGECNSCRMVSAGTHPDLSEIGCPADKSTIPLALLLGEDERRGKEGLCYDLSLRPAVSSRRIAIIDDVERLNEEGANALLKTLEEPPVRAIFFLIVDRAEAVLPTIRSRCQLIRFSPLTETHITELLLETGTVEDPAEAATMAACAGGSLDTAARLADPAVRQLRDLALAALRNGLQRPLDTSREIMEAVEAASRDTAAQRRNARWLVLFLCEGVRARLRRAVSDDPAGDAADAESAGCMLERLIEAEQQLDRFMPVALCIDALFDDLRRLQPESV